MFSHVTTEKDAPMGLIFLVVAGAITGWLAAIMNSDEDRQGLAMNMVAGIGGAFIGGLVLAPLFGSGHLLSGNYSVIAMLAGLLVSVLAVISVNLLARRREVF